MDTPSPSPLPSPPRRSTSLGTVIAIAVLVGGLSGGFFGTVAVKGGIDKLFTKTATTNTASVSAATGTINVQEDSATIDVVKKASLSVVSIIAKKDFGRVFGNGSNGSGSPFNNFFGFPLSQTLPQGVQPIGSGTGFIVSADGLILTNKHVATIAGADQYTVVTNDEKTYDAKVLATDPSTDVAVMKIEAKDLPTISLGNSDNTQVGQTVIAIGNVLGEYRNSVTKGIVSGLGRTITAGDGTGNSETLRNVIQTDAAINHGNSGGPLLDLTGQAIGINTAIDSQGQLVSFALPINVAKRDLESVQKTGKIERPYLGVRYVIVTDLVQQANDLKVNYGALVVRGDAQDQPAVIPGGPADKAGIQENDIILEINGKQINESYDLSQALMDLNIGDAAALKVLSKGQEKTITVRLEARSS